MLLNAYCSGAFPMGDPDTKELQWYSPDPRTIQPITPGDFHVPRRLARTVRQNKFQVTHDRAFHAVMIECALSRPGREETWITEPIIALYCELYERGYAHSIETWLPSDQVDREEMDNALYDSVHDRVLVGGIYGVHLGGAFFGESMFSRVRDASKVALVKLVEHLQQREFLLFDVQFSNPHIEQFGVLEISRAQYMESLHNAIQKPVAWQHAQEKSRSL